MGIIGFIDELTKLGHYKCYGLAIMESNLVNFIWRDLLSVYDKILRSYGGKYDYSEAKFSLLLKRLTELGVPIDRKVLRFIINFVINTLGDRVRFGALVIPIHHKFFSPFANITSYSREYWFLRAYRSKIRRKGATPSDSVIRVLEILDFLLRPYVIELKEICLDQNLGNLGAKIQQLLACIEILYGVKVRICDSQKEKGIQIADFIAGSAFHMTINYKGWLSERGMITLLHLCCQS